MASFYSKMFPNKKRISQINAEIAFTAKQINSLESFVKGNRSRLLQHVTEIEARKSQIQLVLCNLKKSQHRKSDIDKLEPEFEILKSLILTNYEYNTNRNKAQCLYQNSNYSENVSQRESKTVDMNSCVPLTHKMKYRKDQYNLGGESNNRRNNSKLHQTNVNIPASHYIFDSSPKKESYIIKNIDKSRLFEAKEQTNNTPVIRTFFGCTKRPKSTPSHQQSENKSSSRSSNHVFNEVVKVHKCCSTTDAADGSSSKSDNAFWVIGNDSHKRQQLLELDFTRQSDDTPRSSQSERSRYFQTTSSTSTAASELVSNSSAIIPQDSGSLEHQSLDMASTIEDEISFEMSNFWNHQSNFRDNSHVSKQFSEFENAGSNQPYAADSTCLNMYQHPSSLTPLYGGTTSLPYSVQISSLNYAFVDEFRRESQQQFSSINCRAFDESYMGSMSSLSSYKNIENPDYHKNSDLFHVQEGISSLATDADRADNDIKILNVQQYFEDEFDPDKLNISRESLEFIKAVENEAEKFIPLIEKFSDTNSFTDYFVLDEKLMRLIEHLDKTARGSSSSLLDRKVHVIIKIQKMQNDLEIRAKQYSIL